MCVCVCGWTCVTRRRGDLNLFTVTLWGLSTMAPTLQTTESPGRDISEDGQVEVERVNQRVETTELHSFSCKNANLLSVTCTFLLQSCPHTDQMAGEPLS